jgi:hypothetical protein
VAEGERARYTVDAFQRRPAPVASDKTRLEVYIRQLRGSPRSGDENGTAPRQVTRSSEPMTDDSSDDSSDYNSQQLNAQRNLLDGRSYSRSTATAAQRSTATAGQQLQQLNAQRNLLDGRSYSRSTATAAQRSTATAGQQLQQLNAQRNLPDNHSYSYTGAAWQGGGTPQPSPAQPQGRAVLGYDSTGDGRPDVFDTNHDGCVDTVAVPRGQAVLGYDSTGDEDSALIASLRQYGRPDGFATNHDVDAPMFQPRGSASAGNLGRAPAAPTPSPAKRERRLQEQMERLRAERRQGARGSSARSAKLSTAVESPPPAASARLDTPHHMDGYISPGLPDAPVDGGAAGGRYAELSACESERPLGALCSCGKIVLTDRCLLLADLRVSHDRRRQ